MDQTQPTQNNKNTKILIGVGIGCLCVWLIGALILVLVMYFFTRTTNTRQQQDNISQKLKDQGVDRNANISDYVNQAFDDADAQRLLDQYENIGNLNIAEHTTLEPIAGVTLEDIQQVIKDAGYDINYRQNEYKAGETIYSGTSGYYTVQLTTTADGLQTIATSYDVPLLDDQANEITDRTIDTTMHEAVLNYLEPELVEEQWLQTEMQAGAGELTYNNYTMRNGNRYAITYANNDAATLLILTIRNDFTD